MRSAKIMLRHWPAMFWMLVALTASAQEPRLTNASLQNRDGSGGVEQELRRILASERGPAWAGYAAPMIAGEHSMCCYYSDSRNCCGGCALEGGRPAAGGGSQGTPVRLEGPGFVLVLFRIESGSVQKIRTFTEDCSLDGGGLPFYWIRDVRPAESVALLTSYATAQQTDGSRKLSESAVSAIAFHGDQAADRALERFIAHDQPEVLREKTSFWLGNARGRRGYELLRKMVREDPSDRVREKAIFGLSQSREPEAVEAMIEIARNDSSTRVRGQALFWLAQKAGKKAEEAITAAIENDPETEVKKKAVFALTQLPRDEGIPHLLRLAETNRNPAVRKQAIFWLGQSKDPRALEFFEKTLLKR